MLTEAITNKISCFKASALYIDEDDDDVVCKIGIFLQVEGGKVCFAKQRWREAMEPRASGERGYICEQFSLINQKVNSSFYTLDYDYNRCYFFEIASKRLKAFLNVCQEARKISPSDDGFLLNLKANFFFKLSLHDDFRFLTFIA